MGQERLYVIALIVVAILASIPQIPIEANIWGLILVVVGIVGGVMVNYTDLSQRILIYVVAVSLPMIDNSLDNIPAIGAWLNAMFDNMAIGIQGMALGLLVMGLVARAKS